MKIRTLIIDDEPLARERIRILLRDEPDIEVIGECADGQDALEKISVAKPALIFLDVQMPEVDGFEVLRNIAPDTLPVVIFATAFDQYAIKAFDAHAVDYLLKPFKPSRFKEAVERARAIINSREASQAAAGILRLLKERAPASSQLMRIAVKTGERVLFIHINEIEFIEAAGNYAVVHTAKENHVLRDTMISLEARLPKDRFLRISRSAIVNLDCIRELQPMFKGENLIVLKSGRSIPTTRGLREIQERLEFQ